MDFIDGATDELLDEHGGNQQNVDHLILWIEYTSNKLMRKITPIPQIDVHIIVRMNVHLNELQVAL